MQPVRVLAASSMLIGAALAIAVGVVMWRAGVPPAARFATSIVVFLAFLVPWSMAYIWDTRRASELSELMERTRRVAGGAHDLPVADRVFHGDLDSLARDIDDLRTAVVLQRSRFDQYRGAIDQIQSHLDEGLLAVGPKGRVVFANDQVAEMFGDPGTLGGKRVIEVVRKRPVVNALERALSGSDSVERFNASVGDTERRIEIRAFPIRGSNDIAGVAVFLDVTELERLQRVRRDFLDDFSHEVRTPLAGLRTAAETLAGGGVNASDEKALFQVMQRQLMRLERLIQDLSELNRIESGDLVLDRRPVNLGIVLRDLCSDFRERLASGPSIRVEGVDATALADTIRLQQVFSNLIDNACKHGGTEGEIVVDISRSGNEAVVRVSDEGAGIPSGEADRIFNRFYRIDRSRSQAVPGVGLGLAIAKHLVLLHGGAIRAFNRPGGGATFEVRLPVE